MTAPSEAPRIRREALEEAARLIEAYRDDMPETVASAGLRFHLAAAIRARLCRVADEGPANSRDHTGGAGLSAIERSLCRP